MNKLNVANDFSIDPTGRFYSDGEGSGEEFREEVLLPRLLKLDKNEKLEVVLDEGVTSYGSSFLVEGFAGLVKYGHFDSKELLEKLELSYTDEDFEFYKNRIIAYINEASFNSKEYKKTRRPA